MAIEYGPKFDEKALYEPFYRAQQQPIKTEEEVKVVELSELIERASVNQSLDY